MANRYMIQYHSLAIREMHRKSKMRYHYTSVRMVLKNLNKQKANYTSADKETRNRTIIYC